MRRGAAGLRGQVVMMMRMMIDCNDYDDDDRDACCDENCKLRENAICSDKNSPCCHMCQYMAVNAKCRTANYATCEMEAECTGT